MINMGSANDVAKAYNTFIKQACERVCEVRQIRRHKLKCVASGWFHTEWRAARADAIRACEMPNQCHLNHEESTKACKSYKSIKQRKQRQFKRAC